MYARRLVAGATLVALPAFVVAAGNSNLTDQLAHWAYGLGITGVEAFFWAVGTSAACSGLPGVGNVACLVVGAA